MSEIKPDEVQRLAKCLAEMPDAESPLTKRKTVALLASAIQQARDKGYTLKHIARQLQNNGFDIGYTALRNELSRQKKARSGPRKPRATAKEDPRTRVVTPLSGATPRDVAPAKASRGSFRVGEKSNDPSKPTARDGVDGVRAPVRTNTCHTG